MLPVLPHKYLQALLSRTNLFGITERTVSKYYVIHRVLDYFN
jgi:hypothetical protein